MGLEELRNEIDEIDKDIIELLGKRFEATKKIGQVKIQYGFPLYQPEREQVVLRDRKIEANKLNIDEQFIDEFFSVIFRQSRKIQGAEDAKGI